MNPRLAQIADRRNVASIEVGLESEAQVRPGRAVNLFIQNLRTSVPLLVADIAGIACAFGISVSLAYLIHIEIGLSVIGMLLSGWVAIVITYWMLDLYPGVGLTAPVEFRQTSIASTVAVVGLGVTGLIHSAHESVLVLGIFWLVAVVAVPASRSIARSYCTRFEWWSQPVLVIADRDSSRTVLKSIWNDPHSGLRPVGVIYDPDNEFLDENESPTSQLPAVGDIAKLKNDLSVHRAIVKSDSPNLDRLCTPGVGIPHVNVVSDFGDRSAVWAKAGERAGLSEVQFKDCLLLPGYRFAKRCMDLIPILMALPILLPLFVVISVLIRLSSKGPVFYCQRRVGLNGHHFYVWKFRTMVQNADQILDDHLEANPHLKEEWDRDHKLKKDPRIIRIGAVLRKASLDELPQLWNVFIGEMSLVGPRPIVDAEICKYGDVFPLYTQVSPGITGLWQISGRNDTSYEERLDWDRYYVRNWSPWLDAFILLRTFKTVVLLEGAY